MKEHVRKMDFYRSYVKIVIVIAKKTCMHVYLQKNGEKPEIH